MSPDELRKTLKQQPFEPFRIILSDGGSYEVRHPDRLMVGQRTAIVGMTSSPDQVLFELSAKVDLLHITRIEPKAGPHVPPGNGQ
ncbi:MAG: hypothetical protein ACFCD0_27015 [Gemmataceae bacterium]